MKVRTRITLKPELRSRARGRASDLGISLAEYVTRLLERDLAGFSCPTDPRAVFDLGTSGESDIASEEDGMIGEALAADWVKRR